MNTNNNGNGNQGGDGTGNNTGGGQAQGTNTQVDANAAAAAATAAAATAALATAAQTNQQQQQQNQPQPLIDPASYTKWTAQWPTATGPIGKALTASIGDATAQKTMAKAAFDLFNDPAPNLNALNGDESPFAAIINIPDSPLFRVIYGFGAPISMLNPTASTDIYALYGDIDGSANVPLAMKLPTASLTKVKLALPSDAMVQGKAAGWPTNWPVWKVSDLTATKGGVEKEIITVAPVPFFTVMDGLDEDLHAIELLERFVSMQDAHTEPYLINAIALVEAALVRYNATGQKPFIGSATIGARPDAKTKAWAKRKFEKLCPNIAAGTSTGNAQLSGQQQGQHQQQAIPPTLQLLLQQMLQQQINNQQAPASAAAGGTAQQPALPTTDPKKIWADKLGMSTSDLELTKILCGLSDGEEALIPKWFERMGEAKMGQTAKDRVCVEALTKTVYPGAPVPTIKPILKMMQTRDWLGGELTATYANAIKGLTPYIVGHLSEETISAINDAEDLLDRATSTTTADVAATKRKLSMPQCFDKLMRLLKRFVNLLHACFGSRCPLSMALRETIAALETYSEGAQDNMSERTLAAILWTIFKQTKAFAVGNMAGQNPLTPEFKVMQDNIVAKQGVTHCELPEKFLTPTKKKRKSEAGGTGGGGLVSDDEEQEKSVDRRGGGAQKLPARTADIHPDIQEKMGGIIAKATKLGVTLSRMCFACNTSPGKLVPPSMCATVTIFGKCDNRKCKRKHLTPTDDQAKNIIQMMEPLILDPTKLPKGKFN